MIAQQQEIVRRVEGLFALADQLKERLAKARGQVEKLTPSLLARAWTHSPPARSGCALSLREILFTRSQRVQISGQLVPQNPTDEPAEKLLNRIQSRS
jgi:type I restriction enzyme S subunit